MAPIHDTDLAAERWSQAEWENYELWEKVEQRLRRRRYLWILGAAILFLALSAVPIVMDRWPKWKTRVIARTLAQEINRVKREASANRTAMRLRFTSDKGFNYVVEKISACNGSQGEVVRSEYLVNDEIKGSYARISTLFGSEMGVPGMSDQFCYDPLQGSNAAIRGDDVVGFGVIPATDLTEKRMDRISVLLISGISAEISFD
jgi:hypothetical protein